MKTYVVSFILLIHAIAWGHGGLGGHAKIYPLHIDADPSVSALMGNFRINYTEEFTIDTKGLIQFELTPVLVAQSANYGIGALSEDYRVEDLNSELSRNGDLVVQQNLDRLVLRSAFEHFDVSIGRQAIAFGSGRVANPTDVFLPFNLQAFNTEYRRGIDAVRFQYVLGLFSELDLGVVAGENESNGFLRFRSQYSETDFAIITARFQQRDLVGLSLQSSLWGNGTWFEIGEVLATETDPAYLRWNLGTDRLIGETTTVSCEIHFNGSGKRESEHYADLATHFAYESNSVFLLGQHYLAPAVGWQFDELNTLSHALFINLDDQSVLMSHRLESSLSDNQYLELGATLGLGATDTEFGTISDVYNAGWKLYF